MTDTTVLAPARDTC